MTHEELVEHIGKVIDEKLDQKLDEKLEPIKKNMATNADIHEIAVDMTEFFHNTCPSERELIPLPERTVAFPNLLRRIFFIISTHFFDSPERIQRILSCAFRYIIN